MKAVPSLPGKYSQGFFNLMLHHWIFTFYFKKKRNIKKLELHELENNVMLLPLTQNFFLKGFLKENCLFLFLSDLEKKKFSKLQELENNVMLLPLIQNFF